MKPLGALRFFLACCVLFGHAFNLIAASVPSWASSAGAIAAQLGVLMFFTVSGYIICYAIEEHYVGRPMAFMANRAMRLYPVHLACYVIALLLMWNVTATAYGWVPKISREIRAAEMLRDLLSVPGSRFLPNPPMWSVAVELQFYAFMALATFSRHRRALYLAGAALVSVATVLELPFGYYDQGYLFSFFAAGVAWFYRSPVVIALSLAAAAKYTLSITVRQDIPNDVMALAVVCALAVFAWLTSRQRPAGRLDALLGGLSYPLYAVHVPILAVIAQGKQGIPWFLTVSTACIACAVLLYLGVERPVMRVRSRLRRAARNRPEHGIDIRLSDQPLRDQQAR